MGQNSSSVDQSLSDSSSGPVPNFDVFPYRENKIDDHPQIDGESKSLRQCQVNPDLSTLEDTSQLTLLHAMPGWKGNILEHVDQPVFIKNKHNFIQCLLVSSCFITFHPTYPMGFPWFSHGFCCRPVLGSKNMPHPGGQNALSISSKPALGIRRCRSWKWNGNMMEHQWLTNIVCVICVCSIHGIYMVTHYWSLWVFNIGSPYMFNIGYPLYVYDCIW